MQVSKHFDAASISKTSLQFSQLVQPFCGVLRCAWKDHQGRTYTVTYGTGTLISPRMVLTCGHSIYSQARKSRCDDALFIPGAVGRLSENKLYKSQQHGFRYQVPSGSLKLKPLSQELALVLLKDPVEGSENMNFPLIGTIKGEPKEKPVFMVAYPNQFHGVSQNQKASYVVYKKMQGKVHSIQDKIINHTIPTDKGSSGGAIFTYSPQGNYFICGIHTHRGLQEGYNSGLYFTPQILNRLEQYVYQLNNEFKLKEQLNIMEYYLQSEEKDVSTEQQSDQNQSNYSQMSFPGYFQQDPNEQFENKSQQSQMEGSLFT